MVVHLYSMGLMCGFCVKAEKKFENELKSGEMVLKTSKCPGAELFTGFPSFMNTDNNLTFSGLPPNKEHLYQKLGIGGDTPIPASCSQENMFIKGDVSGIAKKNPNTDPNTPNGVWWCHKGDNDVVGSVVFMTTDPIPQIKKFDLVSSKLAKLTKLTDYNVVDGNSMDIGSVTQKLPQYFPCTTKSNWSDIGSIMDLVFDKNTNKMKNVDQILDELIPSPCKNDKNFYCCEGNDGPSFFDIKTIIMLCVIGLLFFGVVYLLMTK
jgi:hypothetical protein